MSESCLPILVIFEMQLNFVIERTLLDMLCLLLDS